MNTFLFIMAITPWSLLVALAVRALRKTPVYGKIWVVTEKYMDEFDWSKRINEEAQDLIFVKQTEVDKDFLKGELKESNEEEFIDDPRYYTPGG